MINEENSIKNNVLRGTVIIFLVGLLAKLASFISEAILAAYLGTTYQSDAYYMVTSIQQIVYPMLSVGVWKVFLPIYKEKISIGESKEAAEISDIFITFLTLLSVVVVFLLMLFSDIVVGIVAPGFTGETKLLCSQLVKISSPMYIFITAAAVYSSILQCHNKFFGSQIREVASHIPTILAAVIFYNKLGIYSLAVALVVGGLCRLVVELPFVDWGYRFHPNFKFKNKEMGFALKRLPSAMLSEGINQINTLVDKIMASSLPTGSVASLNYGNRLMSVFNGLFSSAVATALYPQVVELIALNKRKELNSLMTKILNLFSYLMFPITFACIFFANDLVAVAYERGAFDRNSTVLTAGIFACYCLGLFFVACNTVLMNVFYGYRDTKTPMYINLINLIANIVGNFLFITLLGVKGLALSTSTSAIVAFIMNMLFARKYISFEWTNLLKNSARITIAAIVSCGIPALVFNFIELNALIELIIVALIGISLYALMSKILHLSEIEYLKSLIMKRVK